MEVMGQAQGSERLEGEVKNVLMVNRVVLEIPENRSCMVKLDYRYPFSMEELPNSR